MAERSKHHRKREHRPGWAGLRDDWASAWSRFTGRTSTNHKRFALAVFALGALLRVLRMDGPVTFDEALTYTQYAGRGFGFLFSDYTYPGNHILYSALARLSVLVFGVHPWSLRLPALLAGLLVMPLGYAFARQVFNRHIAVLFLCLLAVSGPLVEYSAKARGFSLVWLFTMAALLAGRHFVKTENMTGAVLMALFCALGMWATPYMAFPVLMVFLWSAGMLFHSYESTVRRRSVKLAGAFFLALAFTAACYAPVVAVHSMDHLVNHPTLEENTWQHFVNTQQDRAFDLWAYFTATAHPVLAFAGIVAVTYAAIVSAKYRILLLAMAFGAVPLVMVLQFVAFPAAWTYTLLVFHLGTAIGCFYLLKLVRDKLAPGFTKSQRSLAAGLALLLVFGWTGLRGEQDVVERFPEARQAAAWIAANTRPGDRLAVSSPWDAPIGFYLACDKVNGRILNGEGAPSGHSFLVVVPGHGQTPAGVAKNFRAAPVGMDRFKQVAGWGRLEIFGVE